jgi:2-polyprenyl-3-methyl-5-hydroxy-6-metoxy-1,4-benzoquinol methylase
MEQVGCALCERDDAQHLVTKNALRVVRCRQCGLIYVNPRPSFDALTDIYAKDDYCQAQVHAADDAKRLQQSAQRLQLIERHYFHARRKTQDARRERGYLLDVGCSTGVFLRVARDAGWNVSGIDVSVGAIEHARRAHQLDAHVATIEQWAASATQQFDLVTMFDSLEHMPQPVAALRAAHQLLKDDGLLVITTPNVDGLFPRFTYRLFAKTIGAWEHPTPPGHIYQFSRQTLRVALEKSGFSVVYCITEAIPAAYTAGKLEEAIIGALKKQGATCQPVNGAMNQQPSHIDSLSHEPIDSRTSVLRRAFRFGVRAVCWGLTLAVSAPAPWFNQGDSMIAFARKASIHNP